MHSNSLLFDSRKQQGIHLRIAFESMWPTESQALNVRYAMEEFYCPLLRGGCYKEAQVHPCFSAFQDPYPYP